jgi:ABC-type lipoprotein export system ATPase subunit
VVGFVFQFHYLIDELTCLENALTAITIGRGEASAEELARVMALLERVGLADQVNKHPDTMSGGQNQRCAIIRALANQPKIVLADEPTGNLDSRSGNEVFNIMREMNRENGVAFIMVTHDDRLAQEADRILMIEDGWVHEVDKHEHRRKLLSSLKEA